MSIVLGSQEEKAAVERLYAVCRTMMRSGVRQDIALNIVGAGMPSRPPCSFHC
jgi:hypothetical protein